jgi:hypothetical protein
MIDRSRAPIAVVATRIGRTDLGEGTVTIDDEVLTILVHDDSGERPIRLRLVAIDSAAVADGEVIIALRDGTRLTLASPSAGELRDIILAHCRVVPELTHALRTFGSRRGSRARRNTAPTEQQRFFAPLLDARRQAVRAETPPGALEAFDAGVLARAVEEAIQALAVERYGENGPARRALEAELVDLSEPLQHAFERLRVAADRAGSSIDDLALWRAWSAELRATFEVADRIWMSLDVALDSAPLHP